MSLDDSYDYEPITRNQLSLFPVINVSPVRFVGYRGKTKEPMYSSWIRVEDVEGKIIWGGGFYSDSKESAEKLLQEKIAEFNKEEGAY